MIEYPHTGIVIGCEIMEELEKWGIVQKVLSISLENATYNDVVEEYLQMRLDLPLNSRLFRVRCCAHILNLIVQDGLHHFSTSIEKIKVMVCNINTHLAKYEIFRNCCIRLSYAVRIIPIDIDHRCNSTYELLQVPCDYQKVLDLYYISVSENAYHCLLQKITENDWKVAEIIRDFLHIFDKSTKLFCGVYYPTYCLVILVNICVIFNFYNDIVFFLPALAIMRTKFDKYWEDIPILYGITIIIDPRFKL